MKDWPELSYFLLPAASTGDGETVSFVVLISARVPAAHPAHGEELYNWINDDLPESFSELSVKEKCNSNFASLQNYRDIPQ